MKSFKALVFVCLLLSLGLSISSLPGSPFFTRLNKIAVNMNQTIKARTKSTPKAGAAAASSSSSVSFRPESQFKIYCIFLLSLKFLKYTKFSFKINI